MFPFQGAPIKTVKASAEKLGTGDLFFLQKARKKF
jgi:hypothetical protein